MSYILDALRKAQAEKESRDHSRRGLGPLRPAPPNRRHAGRVWLWAALIGVGLIVNAGVLIWTLRPQPAPLALGPSGAALDEPNTRQPPPAAAVPTPPGAMATPGSGQPAAPTLPAAGGEPAVASAPREPASPAARPSAGRAQRETRAVRPAAPPAQPDTAQPPTASDQPAPDPALARARPPAQGRRADPAPVEPSQPLPPAIQGMVERMKLQMVVYSDVPSERLVFIDNRKYVEGQLIDGKVLVETIEAETAVLSYQGRRFVLRK